MLAWPGTAALASLGASKSPSPGAHRTERVKHRESSPTQVFQNDDTPDVEEGDDSASFDALLLNSSTTAFLPPLGTRGPLPGPHPGQSSAPSPQLNPLRC
jgi:hypothetical protein